MPKKPLRINRLLPLFPMGDFRNGPEAAEGGKVLIERPLELKCGCLARVVLAPGEYVFNASSHEATLVRTFVWYFWEEHHSSCQNRR